MSFDQAERQSFRDTIYKLVDENRRLKAELRRAKKAIRLALRRFISIDGFALGEMQDALKPAKKRKRAKR